MRLRVSWANKRQYRQDRYSGSYQGPHARPVFAREREREKTRDRPVCCCADVQGVAALPRSPHTTAGLGPSALSRALDADGPRAPANRRRAQGCGFVRQCRWPYVLRPPSGQCVWAGEGPTAAAPRSMRPVRSAPFDYGLSPETAQTPPISAMELLSAAPCL
jgi:hypothetical protein